MTIARIGILTVSDRARQGRYADRGGPAIGGKPSAIDDGLNAAFPTIPYCIDLIEGARTETHPQI